MISNKLFAGILIPLSWIYLGMVFLRKLLYKMNIVSVKKLSVPVVCIGNITAGGTGKTPAVIAVAQTCITLNKKPAVLTRGYGRTSRNTVIVSDGNSLVSSYPESGDEPAMIAQELPVPIAVDSNRYRGGNRLIQEFHPDIILMDDGFQHYALHRDINIVTINCLDPWGGGRYLPAGLLREPREALAGADFVILTHSDLITPERLVNLTREIQRYTPSAHILESRHVPLQLVHYADSCTRELSYLTERNAVIVSGIGNGKSFVDMIKKLGAAVIKTYSFPDHHQFTLNELKKIFSFARERNGIIVTTAKDAVRIPPEFLRLDDIYKLTISLTITKGKKLLTGALQKLTA